MAKKTPPHLQRDEHAEAVQHVAEAHQILQHLRDRLKEHPELELAILKLETALNILTIKTGGML